MSLQGVLVCFSFFSLSSCRLQALKRDVHSCTVVERHISNTTRLSKFQSELVVCAERTLLVEAESEMPGLNIFRGVGQSLASDEASAALGLRRGRSSGPRLKLGERPFQSARLGFLVWEFSSLWMTVGKFTWFSQPCQPPVHQSAQPNRG